MTPSVAKYIAWRSRGMIWVEIGSGVSPIAFATCSSTRGSIWANVPIAPEIATFRHARIEAELQGQHTRGRTVVGERSMGDARLDYNALQYGWFDHFLKGDDNKILENTPKVRYFTMGTNKWQTSDTWPPQGSQRMNLFLSSDGRANSLFGDGALSAGAP